MQGRRYPGTYAERLLAVMDDRRWVQQQQAIWGARMAPATAIATLAGLVAEGRIEVFRGLTRRGGLGTFYRRVTR